MKTNLYRELQRISIEDVINEMVELALPRGTTDKILMINIRFQVENFKTNFSLNKHLILIYYRPNNYTFVGKIENDYLLPESKIEYLSHHDSCWRHGTSHTISEFSMNMEKEIISTESEKSDFSIYTTFDAEFISGSLQFTSDHGVKFIK